jgi:hypothetical protein
LLAAVVWPLLALAFFVSWMPEKDAQGPGYVSEAVWYGLTYALWIPLSQVVYLMARRYPVVGPERRRNLPRHALAAPLLAMTHVTVFLFLLRAFDPDFLLRYPSLAVAFKDNFIYRTLTGSVTYGVVLFVLSAGAALRRMGEDERRAEELRRRLAEAELQALRMQIQPHFLFNTLHSISSLIEEDPKLALAMIARLGEFLRATLERNASQTLRLEEEIRFAELYLEIEKVRFGDRMSVSVQVEPEARGLEAPSLILQPLVENAVRHGVAPSLGLVDLSIAATRRDGALEITLSNRSRGRVKASRKMPAAGGLGLANTRARLERMYGPLASLSCEAEGPGAFAATLRIPATEAP